MTALRHERAVGDTSKRFAVQLTREGDPVDLTGRSVTFEMYSEAGALVASGAASITDATNGEVEYDFQVADVANAGLYEGYFDVIDSSGEVETFPPTEAGIQITIFSRAADRRAPDPTIDIIGLAAAPIRTRTVEGTVEERSVDELIKADQYTASKQAVDAVPWGIRVAKTKPPSIVGLHCR